MSIFNRFSSDNPRTKTIKKNVAGNFVLRGFGIILGLIQLPLMLSYVDKELYGIWITMSSIISWLSFFNIGFGAGLRNKLATCIAWKKFKLGRIYVSTTYFVISMIFMILCIVCFVLTPYVDWCSLLNINSDYQETLIKLSRIILIAFCLNNILSLVTNVCQSYQMTALSSSFDTIGRALAILTIYILSLTTVSNINYLALAYCGIPLIVLLFVSLYLYTHKFKSVSPSRGYVKIKYAKDLFNIGGQFFLIQIVFIVLYQATNFVISHYCGPTQVTVYHAAYSYIGVATMAYNILLNPIWSAYSDAYALGDYPWMRSIYKKLRKFSVLVILGIVVMVLVSPIVYKIWLNGKVEIPLTITIAVAIYTIIKVLTDMNSNILNGMNVLRVQLIQAAIQVIVYVALVMFLAPRYDIYGVIISLVVSALIPAIILPYQVCLLLDKKATGIWKK